jgi:hypothetical protein
VLFAQERTAYGIYGSFSDNLHSANFQHLPGVPSCCPRFETGSGGGASFGAVYIHPLASNVGVQVRAGYQSLGGTLTETEVTTVYHNGAPTTGAFKHTLEAHINEIGIQPMIDVSLFGALKFSVGARVAAVITKTFSEQEQIVQPDGAGTFADSLGNDTHSRLRNQYSGTIPNAASVFFSGVTLLSYTVPMNEHKTIVARPEISFIYGFTPVADNLAWHINAVRFGVAILFSAEKRIQVRER